MKRVVSFILTVAVLFSSCAASSNKFEGAWADWTSSFPEITFEPGSSNTFTLEEDGFSVECTVETWVPMRGADGFMFHPADSTLPIPSTKSSACVVPFTITSKTTTQDSSFTTDYRFVLHPSNPSSPETSYLSQIANIYTINMDEYEMTCTSYKERSENPNGSEIDTSTLELIITNSWREYGIPDMKGTNTGDENVLLGVYVLHNFYSPDHPSGNTDLLPNEGAKIWLDAYFVNQSKGQSAVAATVIPG